MNSFKSVIHPEMNPFLTRLEIALKKLPNNPKPSCESFSLCYYDGQKNVLMTESIGDVPGEKNTKYLHFATKKVIQTLFLNKKRSAEFASEDEEVGQYSGALRLILDYAGVAGHNSWVDEAISALWLVTIDFIRQEQPQILENADAWIYIERRAQTFQAEEVPDNKWISIIATLLVEM